MSLVRTIAPVNHQLSFLLSGPCWKRLNSIVLQNSALKSTNPKTCKFRPILFIPTNIIFRESYGKLYAYDKSYDRVTTKTEKPLQLVDRIKYNTTTSDDPVIQAVRLDISARFT